jgi:hypothetical protein
VVVLTFIAIGQEIRSQPYSFLRPFSHYYQYLVHEPRQRLSRQGEIAGLLQTPFYSSGMANPTFSGG